jgi:hypothetical protein
MRTMMSNWRRIACSAILVLFSASVIAGTVCTGHSTAHAARAQGWVPGSESSHAGHAAAAKQHGGAGHSADPGSQHEDSACDPPVYAGTTASFDNSKQADRTSVPQIDAMASGAIDLAWSESPASAPSHAPPHCVANRAQDVLALCPRLRI